MIQCPSGCLNNSPVQGSIKFERYVISTSLEIGENLNKQGKPLTGWLLGLQDTGRWDLSDMKLEHWAVKLPASL